MISIHDVMFGLGLPTLVGIVFFFLGRRKLDPNSKQPRFWHCSDRGATVFAIGVGFVLGCSTTQHFPSLPPKDPIDCLYLAAVTLTLLAAWRLLLQMSVRRWRFTNLIILAASVGGIVRLLPEATWTLAQRIGLGSVSWLAAAVVGVSIDLTCRRTAGSTDENLASIMALTLLSALATAVLGMSGSQVYGQVAAILPAVLAPVVLLAIPLRTIIGRSEIAPIFVLLLGGMLLCGFLFAELTALNAALLFFSPLALWIGAIPVVRGFKAWQRFAFLIFAVLVPAGIAFGLATHKFLIDMAEFAGY